MNNIIKYKKIIKPKNLHKIGLENLGMGRLEKSNHEGA